jgi:ABC-type multidrug transport system ATPase subunit/pSer/pThr/pTyr-binding forkhead associated (FHA) protein
MNIVLVEERAGAGKEHSFEKGRVVFGRDANECDIAFDNAQYPMVSRKHAEIVNHQGQWLVVDLGSSYGTYLNGQRIAAPTPIAMGNGIQFGTDGPMFRVIWFDGPSPAPSPVQQQARPPQGMTPAPAVVQPVQAVPPSPPPKPFETARLEFVNAGSRQPFALSKPSVWLGRDPSCEIIFDSSSGTVSRKHAEIKVENGDYVILDNNSFNGTLVNEQRITTPIPLYNGDEIQLGIGGPELRFSSPSRVAPAGADLAGQRSVQSLPAVAIPDAGSPKTIVFNKGASSSPKIDAAASSEPQLIMTVAFGQKNTLTIGRDDSNDISLDGLQISKRHAKLVRSGADVVLDDLGSTNGVFINGNRVSRQVIRPEDSVQIGTFVLRVDPAGNISVFDSRAKTRIDAVNITRRVKDRSGRGEITLLDGVSLSIQPNEFVGLLGPSGAGKSSLIEAMNGNRPATSGNVLVNNQDLYRNLDSLKQSIGYVPQDDIIHKELSVYRTLFYVAKLRLSRDVTSKEIDQIVEEVMDVTGLAERRDVAVRELSGGQRKRVSMAVELITKPSIIFLDEPTSGLDPATEEKIMLLFRQIAESGRTVIMTTHAMENVRLFDKIVVLMRGKLVFYGKPAEALEYLGAKNFKELFDKLEEPITKAVKEKGDSVRSGVTDHTAETWKQKFLKTPQYERNVQKPIAELGKLPQTSVRKKRRLGIFGAISQWATLSRRYLNVLFKDKLNLFILLAQAPAIAILTFLVMGANAPRDFVYFVLALVAFWFGTSVAAREIIRERPIYRRERMVNLGILPYLSSKLFVLGIIVGLQCILLFVPLKLFDLVGLMPMPGFLGGIPQFWTMLLTAAVGVSLGLLVSVFVRTSEMATSLVPLILIPQILFSGLVGVPTGVSKAASMVMPAAWSFDAMKRFSHLDTLEEEGADPRGKTNGQGLYKSIDAENDKMLDEFRVAIEEYKTAAKAFHKDPSSNPAPVEPELGNVKKIPDNLSNYVTFLHPWMLSEVVSQIVLMLMFGMLVIVTLIVLRLQDLI